MNELIEGLLQLAKVSHQTLRNETVDIGQLTQDIIRSMRERDPSRRVDHGDLPAYRFGRVIRLRAHEVEAFIESSRIKPGELEHLYPEPVSRDDD